MITKEAILIIISRKLPLFKNPMIYPNPKSEGIVERPKITIVIAPQKTEPVAAAETAKK
jgi:hypothetical protein